MSNKEDYLEILNGIFELITNGMWFSIECEILSERADSIWYKLNKEDRELMNKKGRDFWNFHPHLIGEVYIKDIDGEYVVNSKYIKENNE